MRVGFFTIIIFVLYGVTCFSQQNFEIELEQLLQQPEYKNASVGIHIRNMKTGETLFGLNTETLLIPASTLKLITSATALELLGANYRFTTKVGFTGKINKNKLKGDLVVIGGGDPALGSEHFKTHYNNPNFLETWATKIKAAGFNHIEGDLVFDGYLYGSEKIPPTWNWEDIGNYYGAGPNALTVYDNLFRITFRSPPKAGEPTQIISMYPKIEGLEIKNEVLSSDINSDQAYVFGSPLDKTRKITGTIPKNRKSFTIKAAVHHPEELLAAELLQYLAKAGIFISGKVKFEKANSKSFQAIYIQESPTLAEIVKVLNYESVNLFAEHLVKQIASEKTGVGNRSVGIEIIKNFWKEKGVNSEPFFMEDGSGLSHFNAVSAEQFTQILTFMHNQSQNHDLFLNSLPCAGSGTLSGFDSGTFPGNTLQAKSGSMTRVRCYAGYLQLDSGEKVAFSILINHFSGSHSKLAKELEKVLQTLQISR